jgi:hypothetical protein
MTIILRQNKGVALTQNELDGNFTDLDTRVNTLESGGSGYSNGDVDTHLNQSTASTNEVLSWNGSDYAWVANPTSINDLSDVDTTTSPPITGEVLKWDGAKWAPGTDITSGGSGTNADTLDGQDGSYYLNYNNFTNTPTIPTNNNQLTNGAGYITGYTVTQSDVTTHQAALSITQSQISDLDHYTDADVNTHLNQSTATTGQVLSWDGSDYDWIAQTGSYSNGDVDTHLNTNTASTDEVLSWNGSDYAWVSNSGNTVYQSAAGFDVTNNGSGAYRFSSHYNTTDNPTIYLISGHTYAFNLNVSGHPFHIQTVSGGYSPGNAYSTGLIHVATDGTISTDSSALLKQTGILYWRVPASISGNYYYACQFHSSMAGTITIKDVSTI